MWDHEGILRDLRTLAQESCADSVLAKCLDLLSLPPVHEVVTTAHQSVQPYLLREFLRTVVDHADPDNVTVKAAGALIGIPVAPWAWEATTSRRCRCYSRGEPEDSPPTGQENDST